MERARNRKEGDIGWEKWYEDYEVDPGPFSFGDLLQILLLPLILVFGLFFAFILILAGLGYAAWLGVKEIMTKSSRA